MRPSPAPERQVLGSMVCMYLPNFLIISKVDTRGGSAQMCHQFPHPQCEKWPLSYVQGIRIVRIITLGRYCVLKLYISMIHLCIVQLALRFFHIIRSSGIKFLVCRSITITYRKSSTTVANFFK